MSEIKINISDLKNEGSDVVADLAKFLEEKANVETALNEITVKSKSEREAVLSRTYVRVLLRKFLHRSELKKYYRVIGGKDNTLIVKEKKIGEEEEE